jgi:hypothetical protein
VNDPDTEKLNNLLILSPEEKAKISNERSEYHQTDCTKKAGVYYRE